MSERFLTDDQTARVEAAKMSLDWGTTNATTVARSQPIHTPGPVDLLDVRAHDPVNITLRSTHNGLNIDICEMFEREANARLIRAGYNAFDSAAKKLGINAVEFAERMQEGGISELVDALGELVRLIDAEYGEREVNRSCPNARTILAKVYCRPA